MDLSYGYDLAECLYTTKFIMKLAVEAYDQRSLPRVLMQLRTFLVSIVVVPLSEFMSNVYWLLLLLLESIMIFCYNENLSFGWE